MLMVSAKNKNKKERKDRQVVRIEYTKTVYENRFL